MRRHRERDKVRGRGAIEVIQERKREVMERKRRYWREIKNVRRERRRKSEKVER